MLSNYLKVAIRVLIADRFFSIINIVGLSVGLACTLLLFFYVKSQFAYDTWLSGSSSLYRLDTLEKYPGRATLKISRAPGPVRDALLNEYPQIQDITRAYATSTSVIRDGQPFNEDILVADTNFFSMLGLPMVSGSPEAALRNTTSVALSKRMAEKYFGSTNAIGRKLVLLVPEKKDFEVGAVFETIPENSHMAFDIVIPMEGYFKPGEPGGPQPIPEQWGGAYFHTYIRLKEGSSAEDLQQVLPDFVDRHLPDWIVKLIGRTPHEFYEFRLVPFRDIHFNGAPLGAMKPPGNRATVLAFLNVAGLILVIAGINFTNLSTARSTIRAREIALRRTLGAGRQQIMIQFFGEAFILTVAGGILALALLELATPYVDRLLGGAVALPNAGQLELWLGLLILVVITSVGAGIYPSLVLSRVRPIAIFNPGQGIRAGNNAVRVILVLAQFAISIALIIGTIVLLSQLRFMQNAELGFDANNILIVRVPDTPQQAVLARTFKERVLRHPDIVQASISSSVPSDGSEDNVTLNIPGAAKPIQVGYHTVDSSFFSTYGVTPEAGRISSTDRSPEEPFDQTDKPGEDEERTVPAVLNEAALGRLGFTAPSAAVGAFLRSPNTSFQVVGVVPNLHFRSLHEGIRDELYWLSDTPGGVVSIRYRTEDLGGLLRFVDRTWAELAPDRAINRTFLDTALDSLYSRERAQAGLLTSFTVIAIVLSCLGLLAMTSFSIQRRTKELAIRKVMGARSRDIAQLLLWQFSRPVIVANLIAWPIAYIVLSNWLEQFAYRIDLPFGAFLAGGAIALLIAWAIVGAHILKVSNTNPADTLRHE